MISSYIS
jgi:hypothetical protein